MIFSTLGSGMNFSNLSAEGYAAFVLAIIFSIVSVASIIYFLKHQDANKIITVLATIVFPVIAVFCWVYLLTNVFSYPINICAYVALGVAVGYLLLSIAIAYIIIACMKAKARKAEEQANLTAETQTEEETINKPLLLTSSQTAEETVEEETKETAESEEVEEVVTDETVVDSENEESAEQGVVFSNTEKKTFAEQLDAQSEDIKAYFNEIIEYAMSMPNTKRNDSKFHTTVKIGRLKLLDSKFAKEVLVCNFMAGSSELKNYSQAEKAVKIKEKPVVIEIDSAEAVTVAKNMIDIAYKNISDAHEEKLETKQAQKRKKKNTEQESTENVETVVETNEAITETEETVEAEVAEVEATEAPVEEKPKKRRGRRKKSEIEAEKVAKENAENTTEETTENNATEENSSEENADNSSEENE